MKSEEEILTQFKEWANDNELVRTAVLTSSRARENANVDFLSDYDIELYVSDIKPFVESDGWITYFGEIMVRWPYKPRSTIYEDWITRLILFKDGTRFDFQITDQEKIQPDRYDNGYKILVDKDNQEKYFIKPSYSEFIIREPTEEKYDTLVHEFWWDAYYVPKYLWRDELPYAKYMLDYTLRYSFLHKIIDWHIGYENNWSVETGALGKNYKKLLSKELWNEFEQSYVGGGIRENWKAFFKVTDLFRKVAKDVGQKLGYNYPVQVDQEVMEFCNKIKTMKKR
ncbi:MAG: aminoglycoside 6-adenylyltransferase [Halanaerobiales bacterium]